MTVVLLGMERGEGMGENITQRRRRESAERIRGMRVVVFRRADGWYPLELSLDADLAQHAELNPGTLQIEDVAGNVLWRPQ